jgi:DnaJ-domain-containing protein 1
VIDPFIAAAGPAPARGREALLRQLALLGVAAASDSGRASADLAATLLALDAPGRAARQAAAAGDQPWARWWGVLAAGQEANGKPFARAVAKALAGDGAATSPDSREVARRLGDLADELAALGVRVPGCQGDATAARFAVDGHRARPERRVLLAGRSSAAYLVEPGWDALRLVRLAPSDGPAAGNRAHLRLDEVIAAVRRGDAGSGRAVPEDTPPGLDPDEMLTVLREDPAVRDRRLVALANEVREERERLVEERMRLEQERSEVQAEKSRLRRLRPAARMAATPVLAAVPRTPGEAAALLGVDPTAGRAEIERSYRAEIARCHPDRVDGMHPEIQQRAKDLAVALNAARDVLLGRDRPARAARR